MGVKGKRRTLGNEGKGEGGTRGDGAKRHGHEEENFSGLRGGKRERVALSKAPIHGKRNVFSTKRGVQLWR